MSNSRYRHIDDLVSKVQAGNGEALADLAHFYRPLLRAAVKRCLCREPDLQYYLEDMDTEVHLVLHELVKVYNPELSYFSYYLSTRLDYAILAHTRKVLLNRNGSGHGLEQIKFSEMPDTWEPEFTGDPLGRAEMAQSLQDAVEQLRPRQKEAVELYYFRNHTQEEAAQILGITQTSFCKRLQRAIESLKQILPEETFLGEME